MKGFLCKNYHSSRLLLTALFAVLLSLLGSFGLFTSSVSAIDYDPSVNGRVRTNGITCNYQNLYQHPGEHLNEKWFCSMLPVGEPRVQLLGSGDLYFDSTIPKNSIITLYAIFGGVKNDPPLVFPEMPALTFSNGVSSIDQSFLSLKEYYSSSPTFPGADNPLHELTTVDTFVSTTLYVTEDINSLHFNGPFGDTHWSVSFLETISYLGVSDAQSQIKDEIQQGNQAEQDRYDQEKQEESEREESAKNDGNSLAGIFNISILNPFAGIWEIFNPGGCTSIPTISSWLHSEDTQYCSWWPQSIRATLTPVFSLASMVILFGFVVRWLGGGNGISGNFMVPGLTKGM